MKPRTTSIRGAVLGGYSMLLAVIAIVLWATWDMQPHSLHARIVALESRVAELEAPE